MHHLNVHNGRFSLAPAIQVCTGVKPTSTTANRAHVVGKVEEQHQMLKSISRHDLGKELSGIDEIRRPVFRDVKLHYEAHCDRHGDERNPFLATWFHATDGNAILVPDPDLRRN